MQGVVEIYDPQTGEGIVVGDADRGEYLLAPGALEGSVFRLLRQGQRVVFDVDSEGQAAAVRTGAEPDLGMPTARV